MATLFTIQNIRLIIFLYLSVPVVEVVNFLIQYSVGMYTYWIIIMESSFLQRDQKQFWTSFEYNVKRFCSYPIDFKCYLLKFTTFLFTSVSLFFTINVLNDLQQSLDNFGYLMLYTICQIRGFYYIFCLKIMSFQVKSIESKIKAITFFSVERQSYQFNQVREFYQKVHEMSLLLNNIFGWSHAALILFCFYKFMTEINWTHVHFHEQSTVEISGKYFFTLTVLSCTIDAAIHRNVLALYSFRCSHHHLDHTFTAGDFICF